LILAPPMVRRFVVAHEVAHLVHLNHGPEFKALEEQLFDGDVPAARALLRQVGGRLRRIVGRL
jgi:predicted metal-dependent hydrolase